MALPGFRMIIIKCFVLKFAIFGMSNISIYVKLDIKTDVHERSKIGVIYSCQTHCQLLVVHSS